MARIYFDSNQAILDNKTRKVDIPSNFTLDRPRSVLTAPDAANLFSQAPIDKFKGSTLQSALSSSVYRPLTLSEREQVANLGDF